MTCIELIFFIAFLFNSIAYSSRIGGFISLITLKPESTAKIFIFYKIKTKINYNYFCVFNLLEMDLLQEDLNPHQQISFLLVKRLQHESE